MAQSIIASGFAKDHKCLYMCQENVAYSIRVLQSQQKHVLTSPFTFPNIDEIKT